MLKLAVTAFGSDLLPTVALERLDELANLHVALKLRARRITSELTGRRRGLTRAAGANSQMRQDARAQQRETGPVERLVRVQ